MAPADRCRSARVERSAGPVAVVAVLLSLSACRIDDLDLGGKTCPCTVGWSCDEQTNTCVPGPAKNPADAGADAGADAEPADGGCDDASGQVPGLEGPRGWPSCGNGVDDDCDGFTDEDDADCGLVYSVAKAAAPPAIDGDCAEYAGAQSLSLPADADNVIVYWLMWDETAIYVCAQVEDDSLDAEYTDPVAHRDGELWRDDCLEIFFDVDHDGGPSMQPRDYKFFINVFDVQADSDDGDRAWSTEVDSAVQTDGTLNLDGDTDRGFTAEFAVPWSPWGLTPPTHGTIWGADLAWNDRDEVAATEDTMQIWANTVGSVNTPDGFGDLLFLE